MTEIRTEVRSTRRMIMPGDMNPHGTLFGGKMAAFIDEAAAIYAVCQVRKSLVAHVKSFNLSEYDAIPASLNTDTTARMVTVEISTLTYKHPVYSGDILEFQCSTVKVGTSSLTVRCTVNKLHETTHVTTCDIVFVHVDGHGKAQPHFIPKEGQW